MTRVFSIVLFLAMVFVAGCGDDPVAPKGAAFTFDFADGFDDWEPGTTSTNGWGSATWSDRKGGIVHLDGTGGPGEPNSWISRELTLPGNATELAYDVAGHDRRFGDSGFRVRIEEGGVSTTVRDWEVVVGSDDGDFDWHPHTDDISAFAGKTVTLFLEQDDDGDGTDEHIYLDNVVIR